MAPAENFSLGLSVEVGKISKELKKLWESNEGAMTRASLINLALYSETADSLATNTQLISRITENHACRAIVIEVHPAAKENHVEAWVSAHCHVTKAGSKQICSEQLSFLLQGPCTATLPNIVFSQLDSDLPLYLWWQGEFRAPMDAQLWARVDRIIYDSQTWGDFRQQLELLETVQEEAGHRIVLCDLNWTRLDRVRLGIAQFFDHPATHHHFNEIERGEIEYAPQHRSTAVLLAGWLAAQLDWKAEENSDPNRLNFSAGENRRMEIKLREVPGEPIGRVQLVSGKTEFLVTHAEGADLLEVSRGGIGQDRPHQLMPAAHNEIVQLLSDELMRGGPHKVYLRAVNTVRQMI